MVTTSLSRTHTQADGFADGKLYIWDVETNTVSYFNFETGRGEQDEYAESSNESDPDYDQYVFLSLYEKYKMVRYVLN